MKLTHNVVSQLSLGASMCLFAVSVSHCLDSLPWAVVTILSMWYCLIWLAVNSMGE